MGQELANTMANVDNIGHSLINACIIQTVPN